MKMFEIGRLCVKIAGRQTGSKVVIVDILDKNFVLIDGQVKRKRCNITHLEPLPQIIKIKKNASSDDIKKEFEKLNIKIDKKIINKTKKTKASKNK
ncbi:MAG: 50S ribosomal protein L14e [Candidatus Woesearchaeota archaeon]|nr:50S ribosomal protein L14e [Candidatus Woesearchaeota archaeon]